MSMIPPCFDNYIGVRDYCAPEEPLPPPTSGLYIEALESIDLAWAAKGAQKSDLRGYDFFLNSMRRAVLLTKQSLFESMGKYNWYTPLTDVDHQTIGAIDDNVVFEPLRVDYRGVRVERTPSCNRLLFKIPCVTILTETDQTVDLRITDGPNVHTWQIETIGGQYTTEYIDYAIQFHSAYIEIANGDFAQTKLDSNAPRGNCRGCQPIGNEYYRVNGWDGSARTNETHGLMIDFSFQCDEWGFVCKLRHRLGDLVLYKTGQLMVERQIFGMRSNVQTENYALLQAQADHYKSQFEQKLKYVVSQLPEFIRSYDHPCFQCVGNYVVSLIP